MSLFVGPRLAVAVTSMPGLFNNIILLAQRWDTDSLPTIRRVSPVLVSGAVGIVLGSFLLVSLDQGVISIILGITILLFVLTDKLRQNWTIPPEKERVWAIPAGFASGLMGGVSGIAAPLLVAYLFSLKLDKRHFVYAISSIFVMFGISLTLSLFFLGAYTWDIAFFSAFCIIPLFLGTVVGTRVQDKISQKVFNRLVLITLFIVGLDLLRRGFHLF